MNKIVIKENEVLQLDSESIEILRNLKFFEELPIKITENTISFPEYTVGVIKLGDTVIEIHSRNEHLSIQRIFEMHAFVNSDKSLYKTIEGYNFNLHGVEDILYTLFINLCLSLTKEGVTGTFEEKKIVSKILYGEIDFSKYNPYLISNGIPNKKTEYNLNSSSNRLIKSALTKIYQLEPRKEYKKVITDLLTNFDNVPLVKYTKSTLEVEKRNSDTVFTSNRFYKPTLKIAIDILSNLKATYKDGLLESEIFLVNSNDIFEKYVRKILKMTLNNDVRKWDTPKEFAQISKEHLSVSKCFTPDILIDYNANEKTARAVFDVKNKFYNPANLNADIVSSSDIYQLLFYTQTLKSSVGCLIYPTNQSSLPIRIDISAPKNPILFLVGINMNLDAKERHFELINLIRKDILIYT